MEFRYSLYDVASPNARGVGGLSDVSRGSRLDDRDQTFAASLLSSGSSVVVNEARAQYTRSRLGAPVNDLVGPAMTISGVANFGTATSSPTARDLDVYEAADTLTLQRGAHLLKAGADLLYNRVTIAFPGALQGSYTFSSIANLDRGIYVQFQQAFGRPSFFQSNPNLALFAQDEWRPRPDVTVNAGLRYDLQWLPDPIELDADNVSPRIGVAWAPGDQQMVVRASGGLYFDRIPLRATSNALQRDGINYKVAVLSFGQAGTALFPDVLPSFPSNLVTAITSIDPHIQDGYSEQFGLQIEAGFGGHRLRDRRLFLFTRARHHHVAQHQRRRSRPRRPPRLEYRTWAGPTRTSGTSTSTSLSATRGSTASRSRWGPVRRPGAAHASPTRCRRRSTMPAMRSFKRRRTISTSLATRDRRTTISGTGSWSAEPSATGRTTPPSVARWPASRSVTSSRMRPVCPSIR